MPSNGGDARLLTSNLVGDFIDGLAWTSDDREIVFGGKQLRRVSATRGEPSITNVSYVPGPATFPAVRGNRLAYVLAAVNANIWKLDLPDSTHAAGEPSKLISSTRQQAAPSFSPDGTRIAFQSDRSWKLGDMDLRSRRVELRPTDPLWRSPLRYAALVAGRKRDCVRLPRLRSLASLSWCRRTAANHERLTNDAAGGEVPSWSRDGKWIYYSSNRNGVIKRLEDAGGGWRLRNPSPAIAVSIAAESFDGEYLYYSRSALDPTIWRIPLRGGPEELVLGVPKPFDPSHWAMVPSGIYVVNGNGDLLFFQFDKAGSTKVFHDQRFLTDWSMAISPDGREIVWAQIDDRAADLMLVENFR